MADYSQMVWTVAKAASSNVKAMHKPCSQNSAHDFGVKLSHTYAGIVYVPTDSQQPLHSLVLGLFLSKIYISPTKLKKKEPLYFQMTEVEVVSDFKTAARTILRQAVL